MRDCSVSGSAPQTTSAASKVHPPVKTARARNRRCSRIARRSYDHSMVARSVCWRASASRSPCRRSSRWDRRSRSSSGLKSPVRPAASSIANGRSSSRVHRSAVAAVATNDGSTASDRAVKSCTASPVARAGTGHACSPPTRRRSRLVASTFVPSTSRTQAISAAAAGSRCSTLSRTRSVRLPARAVASVWASGVPALSLSSRPRAMTGSTSAGSRSGASDAHVIPSGYWSDTSAAAWSARRVFPVPPGPVSVSTRTSSRVSRAATSSSSRSRPTKDVEGTGRFVRCRDLSRGKTSPPSW
jgi:hypothetical protein